MSMPLKGPIRIVGQAHDLSKVIVARHVRMLRQIRNRGMLMGLISYCCSSAEPRNVVVCTSGLYKYRHYCSLY